MLTFAVPNKQDIFSLVGVLACGIDAGVSAGGALGDALEENEVLGDDEDA